MKTFAGKAAASADKVRGGYYTPAPDARILAELASLSDEAHGVELIAHEAAKAREFAPVDNENLFDWLRRAEAGGWDGVAGNPPYIRFGNWPSEQRDPALELMRLAG